MGLSISHALHPRPWTPEASCQDRWPEESGLTRFITDITTQSGSQCTVEVVANCGLSELTAAPSLTLLCHGFGVDAFSMEAFFRSTQTPTLCVNFLGAGSAFPRDFEFTPLTIAAIQAAIVGAVAPNISHITYILNSMAGSMGPIIDRLLTKQPKSGLFVFHNPMSPDVLGGIPGQFCPEPKLKAYLHTLLCWVARFSNHPLLDFGLKALFGIRGIGFLFRRLYYQHLYNRPTRAQIEHHEELFTRRPTPEKLSPLEIMSRMARGLTSPGSRFLKVSSELRRILGPSPIQLSRQAFVVSSKQDRVFGPRQGEKFAGKFCDPQGGSLDHTQIGGPHLPDEEAARTIESLISGGFGSGRSPQPAMASS